MSEASCPTCGAEVSGNFCSRCGAALGTRACPSCGADARPGDRFCTTCGSPIAASGPAPASSPASFRASGGQGAEGDGSLGWWVAGLLLVALMVVALIPVLSAERGRTDGTTPAGAVGGQAGAGGSALGPAPNVDLSSMTPREAADRLFDRVMRSAEQGDSAQALRFLPMAIGAYERARPLDADGLFHLSALLRTGDRAQEALETARRGLEDSPDHLLLLAAAAEAARQAGDLETAERHYRHLLEVWDEESARDLEDYRVHSALLPTLREEARTFLDEQG